MAKIGFILFADDFSNDVRTNGSNGMFIRNPRLTITPAYVPGQFSFAALFSFYDLEDNKVYKVHMNLSHKETGDVSLDGDFDFQFAFTPEAKLIGDTTAIGNLQLNNIRFEHKGEYTFKLSLEGNSIEQVLFVYPEPKGK